MPIRSLESFLFESKLVNTSSIEILENSTIGIDVEHYLSRIYTFKKEQFLFGVGGVPSSLRQYIESDLNVFDEWNIKPLFVLPGLKINSYYSKFQRNELTAQEQHLNSTWSRLQSKHSSSGGNTFGYTGESFRLNADPLPLSPMINDLVKLFIECGINYIISPYDSSFQLSYLYQTKVIDCIYGSTDILLTKVDKFILGMEFQSRDFRYVDKQKVLGELNLTERQFLDLSIMVGCSAQPKTFSNLPQIPESSPALPYQQLNFFRIALDMYFQFVAFTGINSSDLLGFINTLEDKSSLALYYRGHAAIKYMPVINLDGYVELYATELSKLGMCDEKDYLSLLPEEENNEFSRKLRIPTDLHAVISQRLPPEMYFYQSIGLLPLKLLEAITSGFSSVRPPLDVNTDERFKQLITSERAKNLLDYQFNLITQLLARYYQVKKIEVHYWFKEKPVFLNNRLEPPVSSRLQNFNVELVDTARFEMDVFWPQLSAASFRDSGEISINSASLIATSFLRALYLLGEVDLKGDFGTVLRIMTKFVESNSNTPSATLEQLFSISMLIIYQGFDVIIRDDHLQSVPKSFKLSVPELSTRDVQKIRLISRLSSLEKFNIHPINYQGPISRSLLNFRSHLKYIQESIQTSLQVCLLDLLARHTQVRKDFEAKSDWYDLVDQLPFFKDLNNTLMGVVSEIYFDSCLKLAQTSVPSDECSKGAQEHLLNHILQVGKPSYNINLNSINSVTEEQFRTDLRKVGQFWQNFKLLAEIMHGFDSTIISITDLELIRESDEMVQMFLI